MNKRQEELDQINKEIRTNQSNAVRAFLLRKTLKLLGDVVKKIKKEGSDQEDPVQE